MVILLLTPAQDLLRSLELSYFVSSPPFATSLLLDLSLRSSLLHLFSLLAGRVSLSLLCDSTPFSSCLFACTPVVCERALEFSTLVNETKGRGSMQLRETRYGHNNNMTELHLFMARKQSRPGSTLVFGASPVLDELDSDSGSASLHNLFSCGSSIGTQWISSPWLAYFLPNIRACSPTTCSLSLDIEGCAAAWGRPYS